MSHDLVGGLKSALCKNSKKNPPKKQKPKDKKSLEL
jgi:hypothetical protein